MLVGLIYYITILKARLVILVLKLLILRVSLFAWLRSAYGIYLSGLTKRVRRGGRGILAYIILLYKSA